MLQNKKYEFEYNFFENPVEIKKSTKSSGDIVIIAGFHMIQ